MRHRIKIWPLMLLTAAYHVVAQCVLPMSVCDLGNLYDNDEPKHCALPVVNAGSDTVSIVNVRTSCGCLKASATADMLLPEDTASINVVFNPQGMMGNFDKTVDIVTTSNRHKLHVKGNVLMSMSSVERKFPIEADSMRFSAAEVVFAPEGGSLPLRCYNSYRERKTAVVVKKAPSFIKAKPLLDPIEPGQMCTIIIDSEPSAKIKSGNSYPLHLQIVDADSATPISSFTIQARYK